MPYWPLLSFSLNPPIIVFPTKRSLFHLPTTFFFILLPCSWWHWASEDANFLTLSRGFEFCQLDCVSRCSSPYPRFSVCHPYPRCSWPCHSMAVATAFSWYLMSVVTVAVAAWGKPGFAVDCSMLLHWLASRHLYAPPHCCIRSSLCWWTLSLQGGWAFYPAQ